MTLLQIMLIKFPVKEGWGISDRGDCQLLHFLNPEIHTIPFFKNKFYIFSSNSVID